MRKHVKKFIASSPSSYLPVHHLLFPNVYIYPLSLSKTFNAHNLFTCRFSFIMCTMWLLLLWNTLFWCLKVATCKIIGYVVFPWIQHAPLHLSMCLRLVVCLQNGHVSVAYQVHMNVSLISSMLMYLLCPKCYHMFNYHQGMCL